MSKELGTLVIVVLKGQHLIDNHTFYKQNPYVKLSLSGTIKNTPVDPKGGQHPVWDVELRFPISRDTSKSNRTLTISVFSEEKKDDELLGEVTLDITDTLKSGEFDDWIPLSLKGTQRGDIYLEMTFFATGPSPLNRRASKFPNPAERLARPQQQQQQPPVTQRPQRLVSQPALPSGLTPGGQAPRRNSNEASRQGRQIQQVPLPGAWPGPSSQQRQSTQPSASSLPNRRRSSKDEDAPLPPLPRHETPPKEEFVPSFLRPGGPSHSGPNGTAGHQHTMPNDPGANTTYPPRHHSSNQAMPPFPSSPVAQAHHLHSTSPQPQSQSQPQPQPPTQPHSPHRPSYSTQGTPDYFGGYSQGGHATTQPYPQTPPGPEVSHTQYHNQPHPPPQRHQQQVQHSSWQQEQPQGGPPGGWPYPADNPPPESYVPSHGPPSPGQSYFAASSPKPPPQPYGASQITSPPVPPHNTVQSPPPVPHAWPYAPNTSPVPSARPHSTSPGPGAPVPPTHQYSTNSGPAPPTQHYAPTHPPSAPPFTAHPNSVPLTQPYAPPTGSVLSPPPHSSTPSPHHPATPPYTAPTNSVPPTQPYAPPGPVLSPPPQSATPSPHIPSYMSSASPAFPFPTSPPPMPPHNPTYASLHAPSFPVPSLPVSQPPTYFEPVTPFSPPPEQDLPDPYLFKRYQTPLPLPPGAPQPPRTSPHTRPEPTNLPLAMPASGSTQRGRVVAESEDERAARELQRWEEESARARREQEERDEELARTLDMELNMQDEPGRSSRSRLPPLSTGAVRNGSDGEW